MLIRLAVLALILALFVPPAVQAETDSTNPTVPGSGQPLYFIVNIKPHNTQQHPWTGDLTLKINAEGIINGTYRSTSSRPDPFRGNIITVTGGLNGKNIHLDFGSKGYFPVKGEYHAGEGIIGTAYSKVAAGTGSTMSMTRPPSMSNPRPPTTARYTPMPTGGTGGPILYDFVAKEESKP